MPRPRLPKKPDRTPGQRHAGRRDEILRAAAAVFAERGYHGASMRDIAGRLGVQQAAIYYYFDSKADILEAICRIGITEFLEKLGRIVGEPGPLDARIAAAIAAHLEPLVQRRFYVHAFLFLRRDLPPRARAPLDGLAQAYEALWRDLIKEGQRRGEIEPGIDPDLAMLAILGMCNTVARWPESAMRGGLAGIAAAFSRIVSRGLLAPSRRGRRGKPGSPA
jgi:AcrR family transcriptional regulator